MDVGERLRGLDLGAAECFVVIRREGLAARVGHDLRLQAERLEVKATAEAGVEAEVDAGSLRVLGALGPDGGLDPSTPSARDQADIASRVRREILRADRFPTIVFRSTEVGERSGGLRLGGELSLCGITRPLSLDVSFNEGGAVAATRINQPDFGIKPYKAMLGALRVSAVVEIEVRIPTL